jgi:hypothetical protein
MTQVILKIKKSFQQYEKIQSHFSIFINNENSLSNPLKFYHDNELNNIMNLRPFLKND